MSGKLAMRASRSESLLIVITNIISDHQCVWIWCRRLFIMLMWAVDESAIHALASWCCMETSADTTFEPSNSSTSLAQSFVPSRRRWYGWLLLLVAGPLLLLLLRFAPVLDQHLLHDPLVHVLITGSASLLGMALALFVLQVARKVFDGRVYLIGMGFLSIASIFFIHAISTPDVLMTGRGLATGWSARISLVLGAVFFALSGLDLSSGLNRLFMRYARAGILLFLIFWLIYGAV